MSRCVACQKILSGAEMHTNPNTNQPEDMCNKCLNIVYASMDDLTTADDLMANNDIGVSNLIVDDDYGC